MLQPRLLPEHPALQHERAPRPLPLFLELVREVGEKDPELAKAALDGLRAYQHAPALPPPCERVLVAGHEGARMVELGGEGPPVVLVPSLINPPRIFDLDPDVSLAAAIARMGHRVLLVDWGAASTRRDLDVGGHVERLLLPLLADLDVLPVLIGYCLGGTMAIAAANIAPIKGLVTMAAPWDFAHYPAAARLALDRLWRDAEPIARSLGLLPMEVLQGAFWSLDPERTVRKFARFADLAPQAQEARRFVELEEWANQGEPLPYPAADELIGRLFNDNETGRGEWMVAGRQVSAGLAVPSLHCVAADDQIAPASTAAPGPKVEIDSGHVGMIVGSKRLALHRAIGHFLARTTGPGAD